LLKLVNVEDLEEEKQQKLKHNFKMLAKIKKLEKIKKKVQV